MSTLVIWGASGVFAAGLMYLVLIDQNPLRMGDQLLDQVESVIAFLGILSFALLVGGSVKTLWPGM